MLPTASCSRHANPDFEAELPLRTAAKEGTFFLRFLRPGMRVLDLGCGPDLGYDPFGPDGANANLLVANDVVDPISGAVPHRSQQCRVRKADNPV